MYFRDYHIVPPFFWDRSPFFGGSKLLSLTKSPDLYIYIFDEVGHVVLTSFFFRSFVSEDVMFSRQLMIQTKTPGGGGCTVAATKYSCFISRCFCFVMGWRVVPFFLKAKRLGPHFRVDLRSTVPPHWVSGFSRVVAIDSRATYTSCLWLQAHA